MKHINSLFIVASLMPCYSFGADNVITLFFKPYPVESQEAERRQEKIKKPGKIAQYTMEATFYQSGVAGICASYGGFFEVSDQSGQIIFPRKHSSPTIPLIVTDRAIPIIMFEQTVHHWELEPGRPVEAFMYTLEKDDESGVYFWNATQRQAPKAGHIPVESVIIFAKPKWVYIPLGITPTTKEPNVVLPDIYIKKGINLTKSASYLLYLLHLLGPVHPVTRRTANHLSTQVIY